MDLNSLIAESKWESSSILGCWYFLLLSCDILTILWKEGLDWIDSFVQVFPWMNWKTKAFVVVFLRLELHCWVWVVIHFHLRIDYSCEDGLFLQVIVIPRVKFSYVLSVLNKNSGLWDELSTISYFLRWLDALLTRMRILEWACYQWTSSAQSRFKSLMLAGEVWVNRKKPCAQQVILGLMLAYQIQK